MDGKFCKLDHSFSYFSQLSTRTEGKVCRPVGKKSRSLGDKFSMSRSCGVRQGDVLSPYLFALYIDSIFDKVKRCNFGCSLKWFCLSVILYADDIVLLAPTVTSLQELLHVCETELAWLDMPIIT